MINNYSIMSFTFNTKILLKTIFSLLFIFILGESLFSQDLDIYKKSKDDNLETPNIPSGMSYSEFQILSRNLRLKDMMYAMVVPGYVHFKADEKITGYTLLGLRTVGYIGLGAIYYSYNKHYDSNYNYGETNNGTIDPNNYDIAFVTSLTVIFATYFYDWIHGDYKLKKKQNLIRYKYGLKVELQNTYGQINTVDVVPIASIALSF